jgi:hypothetical protein
VTSISISQPQYFPWPGLFEQMKLSDIFVNYVDVSFTRGFFNRVKIKGPNGTIWLSVPLANFHQGQSIQEVQVGPQSEWLPQQRSSLEFNYKKSPYLKDMLDIFDGSLTSEIIGKGISEISRKSTEGLAKYFDLHANTLFLESTDYSAHASGSKRILEICKDLGADSYITGHGSANYLNHEEFEREKIEVWYMDYSLTPYHQQFGNFNPFVSTLDVVANMGTAGSTVFNSMCVPWRKHLQV